MAGQGSLVGIMVLGARRTIAFGEIMFTDEVTFWWFELHFVLWLERHFLPISLSILLNDALDESSRPGT